MSKLLISTEASTTVFPPMISYLNSVRKITVSSNQNLNKFLIIIFMLEIAILAMAHISFESTTTLIILTSIEGLILLLSIIFCLVYRTRFHITKNLHKFNDFFIFFLAFAIYLLKIEIFIQIDPTKFVSLVGGMTLLPIIILADKCLIRLRCKLLLIFACFLYIMIRMIISDEVDYIVSLQIALVFISSAYFLKRREDTVQSLFSQVFSSYQKEAGWHSILRDFPEPIYLLNPDMKVAFTNIAPAEHTKMGHDDMEKAMITNMESVRNTGNSAETFRFIQELELSSDPELAYQFFKPLCFNGNNNGIDESVGDFLDDKDAQSARKSSRGIMSSPKGFRFSWKNDSGSLAHIQAAFKSPSENLKVWLKGQGLVQLLEVLCKNTKRFYDFYRKSPIVLTGKVVEEQTTLLSPLRSTRDRPKDISGFKSVEIRLSVVNFQQELMVLVMVTEKTQSNPPSSLQSINEYKINLLASFSHELRTPLNGNLNFLETAIQRPDLPEEIKTDYLVPAWTSATLLFYIVSDILDYSQFSLNKIVLRIKSSKISCLLEDIVELFKIQFAKKNLKITLEHPANEEIATDHTRLTQILVNLVSNALKFTEEGGVHLSVVKTTDPPNCYKISVRDTGIGLPPPQKKRIERILKGEDSEKVDSKSVGSNLGLSTSGRLAVLLGPAKGNGITIEPVKKGTKLVFLVENKQQAQNEKSLLDMSLSGLIGNSSPQMMDNSFRSDYAAQVDLDLKDNGIQHIALRKSASSNDLHQADNEFKCKVMSNDSQGMMFTMPEEGKAELVEKRSFASGMLRVKGSRTNTTTMISAPRKKMSMKMHSYKEGRSKCKCNSILIVDDDSFNVMAAEKMFNAVNLTSVSAFHGKQAIQTVESREKCSENCQLFKFILMDCNMPVMDGYDATRYLKKKMKSGDLPYMPIIGCTAFVTYFDATKCFDSGMDDYVTKPLGKEKLNRILEKWVRNRPLVQGPPMNI